MNSFDGHRRFFNKRTSRRRVLTAGAAGAAATALTLTGCGGDDGDTASAPDTPESTGPRSGGQLKQATVNTALSIDPHTEIGQGLAYVPFFQLAMGGGLPYPSEKYPLQFNHTADWSRTQLPRRPPDPEIDASLDKVLETPDIYERQTLVLEVTRMILDRHHNFPLFAPYAYTCMWRHLRGYENVPSAKYLYTYYMWLDN